MLFSQDRTEMRAFFYDAWNKRDKPESLDAMQRIIVDVIQRHPEYHALLEQKEKNLDRDFNEESGQSNPFMHMSLHIALQEQLTTNRPTGIRDLFHELSKRQNGRQNGRQGGLTEGHYTEHVFMDCLSQVLWQAQQNQQQPDEKLYFQCARDCVEQSKFRKR